MRVLVVLILSAVGLWCLSNAFQYYNNTHILLSRAQLVAGHVIDYEYRFTGYNNKGPGMAYFPVIEFLKEGRPIRFVSNVGSVRRDQTHAIGQSIEVFYDPIGRTMRVNDFESLWGMALIPGILGSVSLFLGLLIGIGKIKNTNR